MQTVQEKRDQHQQLAQLHTEIVEVCDAALEKVGELEAEVTSITGGSAPTTTRKRRASTTAKSSSNGSSKRGAPKGTKRPKNDAPLHEYILKALKGKTKGLELKDIVVAVKKSGFKSNAKDFSQTCYVALYKLMNDKKVTKDAESKRYSVQKAA